MRMVQGFPDGMLKGMTVDAGLGMGENKCAWKSNEMPHSKV